eukprot:15461337-Alexandrium_andersonii.AAC.1
MGPLGQLGWRGAQPPQAGFGADYLRVRNLRTKQILRGFACSRNFPAPGVARSRNFLCGGVRCSRNLLFGG